MTNLNKMIEKLSYVEGDYLNIVSETKTLINIIIDKSKDSTDSEVRSCCSELETILNKIEINPEVLNNSLSRILYLSKSVNKKMDGLLTL